MQNNEDYKKESRTWKEESRFWKALSMEHYNGFEPKADAIPEDLDICYRFLQIFVCFICR